ncbi:poly-beta-hydroxybutyrate polymerase, partial [Burkholderia multivorans]
MRAPFGPELPCPPDAVEIATSAAGCAPVRAAPADEWNRAAHANVAAMTFGLSPVSLALAMLDWGAHLAVAPGKCFVLATQAWLAALAPAASPGEGGADDADASGLAV